MSTDKWKSFLEYIHFTANERKLRLHDRKKALFSFKTKLFFFLFLLSTTNVHRLRIPCPRRGIVKYYTGAGRDVRSVTVSNFSSLFFLPVISRGISRPYQKCKLRDARRWRVFDIHHSELLFLLANYFRTLCCTSTMICIDTREKLFTIAFPNTHTQLISNLNEHAQLFRTMTNIAEVSRKSCDYRTFPAHFPLKPIWRHVRIYKIIRKLLIWSDFSEKDCLNREY